MKLPIFHCLPCFTEDVFFIGTGRTIHEIQQKLHTNSTNSATTSDLNGSSEIHLGKCATFDLSLPTWPNALQLYFQTSRICSIVPHQRCVAACQPLKRGQKINEQLSIIVTHCDAQMQEPDEEVRHREFQAPLWSQQGNYVQVWSRKT